MSEPGQQLLVGVMTLFGAVMALVVFVATWRTWRNSRRAGPIGADELPPLEPADVFSEPDNRDVESPNDAHDLNPEPPPRVGLAGVHAADPMFSEPEFVEEVGQLYAAVQRARVGGDLSPWEDQLSQGAREDILAGHQGLDAVMEVTQDLPRIVEATQDGEWAHLEVVFNALIGERRDGEALTLAVAERWSFSRHFRMSDAPWRVLRVLDRRSGLLARPALERAHVVEHGTNLATVTSPTLDQTRARLSERLGTDALGQLLDAAPDLFRQIASSLDRAEDGGSLAFLAPEAAESWTYGMERLARVGLRRRVVDPGLKAVAPARLEIEARTAVATVRFLGQWREWLETLDGTLAGGAPQDVRAFSEYWTFLLPLNRPDARWRLWQRSSDEEYTG